MSSAEQTVESGAPRTRLVTHYLLPVGALVHALGDGFGACNASRDPAKVDCDICLSIIEQTTVTPPAVT